MGRSPRRISSTGTYHVIFRGVNHCLIFEDGSDFRKFLKILSNVKEEFGFLLYAYCLMNNHGHLLIHEKTAGDMALIMHRLLGSYAQYFNSKYQRSGALIANRHKSKCVEDDSYLLTLVRYIHQNPLLSKVAASIDEYRWCSYCDYTKAGKRLTDVSTVLGMFSARENEACETFVEFHETLEVNDYSMEVNPGKSEENIHRIMRAVLGGMEPKAVCSLPKEKRDLAIAALRKRGFSVRQIERATGISRGILEVL
ncbi:MAG: transposase [Eggerthellaceae bacterium]|nr:transposase [Eggerthellaceae bacterium]